MPMYPSVAGKSVKVEAFSVAPGFFVLNENTIHGSVRSRPDLKPIFDQCTALKKNAQYLIATHSVSTPFGYFTSKEQLQELQTLLAELRRSAEVFNSAADGAFKCHIGCIAIPVPTDNVQLKDRLKEFVIDELTKLRDHLLEQGSKKAQSRPFLYQTDVVQRLSLFCSGVYKKALDDLLGWSRDIARDLRSGKLDADKLDLSALDSTKALFEIDAGGRQ